MIRNWFQLTVQASLLTLEAQQVTGLRMIKLSAGGGAASREARKMVDEKILAFGEAGLKAARGAAPLTLISGYRRKVRANRRRLSK